MSAATDSEEVLGIGAMTAAPLRTRGRPASRQPLTPAEAIQRARAILATPDQLYGTEEGRKIFAALVSGIDNGYVFPKPVSPLKRFTV